MKNISLIFAFLLISASSFGQRYQIWVETSDKKSTGNFALSNDSVLMLYTNASLLFTSKDKSFSWDDIEQLKIRNKTKNQMGQIIGATAGLLAFEAIKKSIDNTADREVYEFTSIITLPIFVGTGWLAGYLVTSRKTTLTLTGMSPEEKHKFLNSRIKKRKR